MHPNLIGIAHAGKRCQALSSCIDYVAVLCTTFWTSAVWLSQPCTFVLAMSFMLLPVLYILISSTFCPLPHCTAPLPLKHCVQTEVTQAPCPCLGFPLAPTYSILSVSRLCPYHSLERSLFPDANPEENFGHVQGLVFFQVSNVGG